MFILLKRNELNGWMTDKNVSALLVLYKPVKPSTFCPSFMFEEPAGRNDTRLDSSAKAQLAVYLEIIL